MRWQGDELSDEAIRRATTFQQAFNEMAQGEEFLCSVAYLDSLVSAPLLAVAFVGLVFILPGVASFGYCPLTQRDFRIRLLKSLRRKPGSL